MPDIKEKLIDLLTGYSLDTYEDVQYVADELIAKGAVPVVRCKDCFWFMAEAGCPLSKSGYFKRGKPLPHENDFCSYGERKDGE